MLVPNLHFHNPHPVIASQTPGAIFKVVQQAMPWPQTGRPALASVSSFGISGTNAHVVLEEAWEGAPLSHSQADRDGQVELLPLSAKTEAALFSMAQNWQRCLTGDKDVPMLSDLCYTAAVRRTHHDYRLAVVGANKEDISKQLDAFCKGESVTALVSGRSIPGTEHKVVFVFPGQGSQWIGMGKRLLSQEPLFRSALEECEEAMRPYIDWSLFEQLTASESRSRLKEIACVQPMLFALEVALARLWIHWGICPDAVVGHSMGEIAAAHVAGVLSLSDAARIICLRSRLLQRVSGQGAMAVVGLSLEQTRQAIAGKEAWVSIAVSQSPASTVLSGDPQVLGELLTVFEEHEIFCRPIKVDIASHSSQMDPLLEELGACLHGIKPGKASLPFYSTVTTKVIEGPNCDEAYWVRNLREPVLFAPVIQQLFVNGASVFLEVSPHPVLLGSIQQCVPRGEASFRPPILVLPSLRRDEDERTVLLSTVSALYTTDYPIAWQRISPLGRCVSLPRYPWQREHCWLASAESKTPSSMECRETGRVRKDGMPAHPLLQSYYIHLASSPHTHVWETVLDPGTFSYLNDRGIGERSIIFPATGYIEMACAGAQEAFSLNTPSLEHIHYERALFLSEEIPQRLQMVISRRDADRAFVQFFTSAKQEGEEAVLHASTLMHMHPPRKEGEVETREQSLLDLQQFDLAAIGERCTRAMTQTEHYQAMERHGLHYGPSFQGIEQLWFNEGEMLARVRICPQIKPERTSYILHPAFLDACLQVAVSAIPVEHMTETYLPVDIDGFSFTKFPGEECWVYAQQDRQRPANDTNERTVTLFLLNNIGEVCAQVKGLRLQRIRTEASGSAHAGEERAAERFYELAWEEHLQEAYPVSCEPAVTDPSAHWLILADEGGVGERLGAALEEASEPCLLVFARAAFQGRSAMQEGVKQGDKPFVSNKFVAADAQAFHHLLRELAKDQHKLRGIVHLWSLDTPKPSLLTDERLQYALELGCGSVLHLVQALAEREAVQLFLVTRGAQAVEVDDQPLSSVQAAVWGLGRVVAMEHPELRCTLIDLSPKPEAQEIVELCRELKVQQRQEGGGQEGGDR